MRCSSRDSGNNSDAGTDVDALSRRVLLRRAGNALLAAAASALTGAGHVAAEPRDKQSPGVVTRSNLRYVDFTVGTGAAPQWGDLCFVEYVIYSVPRDGSSGLARHDSTYKHSPSGYLLKHGNGTVVRGMEEALHTMREGGRRRVVVPPALAYAQADVGPVPSSTIRRKRLAQRLRRGDLLVLDIELVRVAKDPVDFGYYSDKIPSREAILRDMAEYERAHPPPPAGSDVPAAAARGDGGGEEPSGR